MSVRPTLARLMICAVGVFVSTGEATAQTYTPYGYFQALNVADMGRIQAKLTFVGSQRASVMTVAFATSTNPMELGLFVPFRRPGFSYVNDLRAEKSFSATSTELKAMIDGLQTIGQLTPGEADSLGILSLALLDTLGGAKAFESIVGESVARQAFAVILGVYASNPAATSSLRDFGCATGLLPAEPPASVDARVAVKLTGLRPDRSKPGQYVGKMRVTNTSATAIDAPIIVLLEVTGPAEVLGADGVTCQADPGGQAYVILAKFASLAPGASIEKVLRFSNPGGDPLDVDFHVFSGPGTM